MDNNIYALSLSGGKDSYYLLLYILQHQDRYPLDYVIHAELDIDYPFIKDVISSCKNLLLKSGIPLLIGKPDKTWDDLYNLNGFPTRVARWCNTNKLTAIKNAYKQLPKNKNIITYIGYTLDEIKRTQRKTKTKSEIYPLIDAKIDEKTILEWAQTIPLYNDYYKYNTRCGCMYCPMKSLKSMAYLLYYYPDIYNNVISMARETEQTLYKRYNRPISVWSGNPKYNTDYRDNIVRTKYLPKLQSMLNACNK